MRVLVTGGSGLLGRTTCAALAARGHEVVALQRHRSAALACEQVLADVGRYRRRGRGCGRVRRRRPRRRQGWGRRQPGGVPGAPTWGAPRPSSRRVATAGVARLVVVSSPSVGYESTPTVGAGASAPITSRRDRSWYSESKAEAELLALAANDPALAVTAIRPHAIWGPGDTQLVGRIVERAREGRLFVVAGGRALIDTTYVDNAADALVAAVDTSRLKRARGARLRGLERRAAAGALAARADLRRRRGAAAPA